MRGTNTVLGGGGFHHVAIKVQDFERSVRFYTDVLGFREKIAWTLASGVRAMMLDTGDGNYLEVFGDPNYQPALNGAIVHIAFRVADVDAAVARVRAAGHAVTIEPKNVTIASTPPVPARLAFAEAPGGVVVEFFANELT
jgi:catechol 2,3-dioxygenase-like lactoylglutathione lyase family enzyme